MHARVFFATLFRLFGRLRGDLAAVENGRWQQNQANRGLDGLTIAALEGSQIDEAQMEVGGDDICLETDNYERFGFETVVTNFV